MRTNIVIDDELMAEAMQVTGINTKREVVEEALRVLVRTTQQKNVLALRGQVQWEGDLDAMRQGRYFHESKAKYTVDESNTTTGGSLTDNADDDDDGGNV
ncbi:MAG: type II toxin-antitoxin system VapB family antitoxin [Caldilineaceae bacterium]|nr:type II toxin-antitoxin system VapB family antitoxin [Caldilineaceae bacterium]